MNYSTFASGSDKDEDGVIINVSSLYARLERVTDGDCDTRCHWF